MHCNIVLLAYLFIYIGCRNTDCFRSTDDGMVDWRHDVVFSVVGLVSEVNPRWSRLVFGWVTIFGLVNRPGV